jgi:hypothetical protein
MRRFVVEHLESHADRIVGDLRTVIRDEAGDVSGTGAAPPVGGSGVGQSPRVLAALAVVVVLLAVGLVWLWYQAIKAEDTLTVELQTAQQQLTATRSALADIQVQATSAAAAAAAAAGIGSGGVMTELVPFGEQPLALGRVDKVQAQLEQLLAQNFHGRVQIESFNGRFCLSGTGDAALPADPEMLQSKCDSVGQPAGQSGVSRESVAFANMLASIKSRARGKLSFSVEAGSPVELAVNYPLLSDKLTAGEWNQAAARNNRVEMHWYPEP